VHFAGHAVGAIEVADPSGDFSSSAADDDRPGLVRDHLAVAVVLADDIAVCTIRASRRATVRALLAGELALPTATGAGVGTVVLSAARDRTLAGATSGLARVRDRGVRRITRGGATFVARPPIRILRRGRGSRRSPVSAGDEEGIEIVRARRARGDARERDEDSGRGRACHRGSDGPRTRHGLERIALLVPARRARMLPNLAG
jgi:hypothetical protein